MVVSVVLVLTVFVALRPLICFSSGFHFKALIRPKTHETCNYLQSAGLHRSENLPVYTNTIATTHCTSLLEAGSDDMSEIQTT